MRLFFCGTLVALYSLFSTEAFRQFMILELRFRQYFLFLIFLICFRAHSVQYYNDIISILCCNRSVHFLRERERERKRKRQRKRIMQKSGSMCSSGYPNYHYRHFCKKLIFVFQRNFSKLILHIATLSILSVHLAIYMYIKYFNQSIRIFFITLTSIMKTQNK